MSKKKRKKAKAKTKEKVAPVVTKKEEKSLVVVDKKRLGIAKINKKVFKKVAKGISIAMIGTISVAYVSLMVLVATSIFYVSHLQDGLIQKGVYVSGINVSGLSGSEAINSVTSAINNTIPEYIVLKYKENTYNLNLQDIGVNFDVETAIDEAYSIGRTQNVVRDLWEYAEVFNNTINIDSKLQYNEETLNNKIIEISAQLPDKVQEHTYNIEADKLVISRGKSGFEVNSNELKKAILSNLVNRNYAEEIEIPIVEVLPKYIDLQAIHDEIYKKPQDAYYTENPVQVYQEIIGVDFDVEDAQNIINTNPEAQQYEINLILTNPNIFVKDLNVFPDTLSTFSTKYANNPNRTINLSLAASKINGTVLMPGEMFSFNKIVGKRTIAAGYKNAAIFVDGKVEEGLAGGICQVSSTLYDAVIGANLEIKERHNHSKLTSYLPGGKDATVVWGVYDFQFVNSREYPIKIEMKIENGFAIANILGIKSDEEYEISIESQRVGVSGVYTVYNAYKVYYQNGVEVKREFLTRDLYK